MNKQRIVVALGGNALGTHLTEQLRAVKTTAKAITDLIEEGHEVVVTHGNGPQVGVIDRAMNALLLEDKSADKTPLSMCVAMSQAYIGYDLQNALREEMSLRGIEKPVATIITQVRVDEDDPAMKHPSKPIGKFMSESEARLMKERYGYEIIEDAGRGFRRVVPSPMPKEIIELDAVKASLSDGSVVICCGGGGIPVKRAGNFLKGVSAVIDKDFASELLAECVGADFLMILTAVDRVKINFGKPDEKDLDRLSAEQARRYIGEGQFAKGSMLEKVEAAVKFSSSGEGRKALIARLENAKDAFLGKTGTLIFG